MIFYNKDGHREYASEMTMIVIMCWSKYWVKSESWYLEHQQSEGHTTLDYLLKSLKDRYIECIKIYLSNGEGSMTELTSWYRSEEGEKSE